MKKARGWVNEGAVAPPEPKRSGTYPPDIARRRRQLGLPVTPAEHAAYDRGETREPPVTELQMARELRAVLPRSSPLFGQVLRHIAGARRSRIPGEEG
jgi:hypothetical protein